MMTEYERILDSEHKAYELHRKHMSNFSMEWDYIECLRERLAYEMKMKELPMEVAR